MGKWKVRTYDGRTEEIEADFVEYQSVGQTGMLVFYTGRPAVGDKRVVAARMGWTAVDEIVDDPAPEADAICDWAEDSYGIWNTACGEDISLEAEMPSDNSYIFCPCCGRPILEHAYIDPFLFPKGD